MTSTTNNASISVCNGCFVEMTLFEGKPKNPDGDSFISECFHVLCRNCRDKGGQRCVVCKVRTRFMAISNRMSSRYLSYFNSSTKMQKEMEETVDFQLAQVEITGSKLIAKKVQFKQNITQLMKMVNELKKKAQRTGDAKNKLETIYNSIVNDKR